MNSDNTTNVLLVATMDTKGQEAHYLEACLKSQGVTPMIMDAGIRGESPAGVAVTQNDVLRASGKTHAEVSQIKSEGVAMDVMVTGATRCALSLYREGKIKGIIALGGSMGTTLGTGVMRAFPIGFPKVMISTMGAQNMRTFVGIRDILMLNSVTDLAGLNRMTRKILRNGAMAISGMAKVAYRNQDVGNQLAFLTTMGPTETCARALRSGFARRGVEAVTFHCTGTGGKAMEKMIQEEKVDMVVDLSLHELMDRYFGGAFDPGPNRCEAAIQNGIPTVLVPGNIDFLVAGPMEQAQEQFPGRKYHKHNEHITCIGTTLEEIRQIAELLADRCNNGIGPITMLVPTKGFSDFSKEGGPLTNLDGPPLFAETFQKAIKRYIHFEYLPHHINDEEFIDAIFAHLDKMGAFQSIEDNVTGNKGSVVDFNVAQEIMTNQDINSIARNIWGGAASPGMVEGTALVDDDLENLEEIDEGTILVCPTISPALASIIPKLKGLVTDRGGILAIAAGIARAHDVPAVVGAANATHSIKTGDIIRINGTAGSLEILAANDDRQVRPAAA